jgi:phage shock protein PspC (stress-responsive transcriptional regulator)
MKQQAMDQTAKGGVLGIITYLAMKYNVDAALVALAMPLVSAVLAWASTKIGDPNIASFVGSKASDGKPVTAE